MSKSLDSTQEERRLRADLVPVDLIKLTVYSDRTAETVDTTYYFARRQVKYDYGNTGTDQEFWPLLVEISPLSVSTFHIPSEFEGELPQRPITFTLSNETWQGTRLAKTLQGKNLANARIEWSQILLAEKPTPPRLDLSSMTGNEHTVFFRGRVVRAAPITDATIELRCQTETSILSWTVANDATITDPEDLGKRLPIVYGQAKKVPAVNWDVGAISTLVEDIARDSTATTWEISDTSLFPASGNARVGREEISWTSTSGNDLTGVSRAQEGTPQTNHSAGDAIVEVITTATYVVAGHEVDAIDDVWVVNPYNDKLVRLATDFTKTTADATTISGTTVASLSFSADQLRAALKALASGPGDASSTTTTVSHTQQVVEMESATVSIRPQQESRDGYTGSDVDLRGAAQGANDSQYFRFHTPGKGGYAGKSVSRWRIHVFADADGGNFVADVYAGRNDDSSTNPTLIEQTTFTTTFGEYIFDWVDGDDNGGWVEIATGSGESDTLYITEIQREVEFEMAGGESWVQNPNSPTLEDPISVESPFTTDVIDGSSATSDEVNNSNDSVDLTFPSTNDGLYQVQEIILGISDDSFDGRSDAEINIWAGETTPWADPSTTANSFLHDGVDGGSTARWMPDTELTSAGAVEFSFASHNLLGRFVRMRHFGSSLFQLHYVQRRLYNYEIESNESIDILGASVGYGLRFFVDVDGYVAPTSASPTYEAGDGNLLEAPCDIMRHWIEQVGSGSVDTTTLATCATDTTGNVYAFDARGLGQTWEEVLSRMAFEMRTNVVPVETSAGTSFLFLTADSTYAFPSASRTISEWDAGGFAEGEVDYLREAATRFVFLYAYDPSLGGAEELAFAGMLRADADHNDLSAEISTTSLSTAEAALGVIHAEPVAFRTIQDAATARDVAAYYVSERIRRASTIAISGVPWWEGYDLEAGDIVTITRPWDTTSAKWRIIEHEKDPETEQITLRCVGVT